jgi:hypothetical protein
MVVIFGSRLMGKVDVVPGMFHVATQFGHINYLPLIPLKTYLILSQNGDQFRGMPISLSFKSILMAWLRAGLFLVAVVASIFAMIEIANGKQQSWVGPLALAVGAWVVFVLTWHRVASRASFRRACQLGELVGLTEEGFAMLQQIYGEAAPRGFAVNAPIPAEPVADVSIVPVSSLSPDSYVNTPRLADATPLHDDAPPQESQQQPQQPTQLGLG